MNCHFYDYAQVSRGKTKAISSEKIEAERSELISISEKVLVIAETLMDHRIKPVSDPIQSERSIFLQKLRFREEGR